MARGGKNSLLPAGERRSVSPLAKGRGARLFKRKKKKSGGIVQKKEKKEISSSCKEKMTTPKGSWKSRRFARSDKKGEKNSNSDKKKWRKRITRAEAYARRKEREIDRLSPHREKADN